MSTLVDTASKFLPSFVKTRLVQSQIVNNMTANRLAVSSKRLDLCAAQIAHVLHLSDLAGSHPLKGKTCLEIGSGWVLSHSLIFYLLGARKVISTDIQRIAHPHALQRALHASVASVVRDVLSPFEDHCEIRDRISHLLGIKRITFLELEKLGIVYVAPVDLAKNHLGISTDFVFSNVVLQSVPKGDVQPLLSNLAYDLSNGGIMIHCIHLEDIAGIESNPFGFYSEPESAFTRDVQSRRGNRIRKSQWLETISGIDDLDCQIIFQSERKDKDLPRIIDPSIQYTDMSDLLTTHLGLLVTKKQD